MSEEKKDLTSPAPQDGGTEERLDGQMELQLPDSAEEEDEESLSPTQRHSIFPYLAGLFATAFLLLLFAYLMQQRDSEEIMGNLSELRESLGHIQSIDQLVEENRQLREENDGLKGQVSGLEAELSGTKESLEEAEANVRGKLAALVRNEEKLEAYHVLNQVRILYDNGSYQEARELMLWHGTFLTLEEALTEISEGLSSQDLKAYDPLAEWQALKEALAEEEDAG